MENIMKIKENSRNENLSKKQTKRHKFEAKEEVNIRCSLS